MTCMFERKCWAEGHRVEPSGQKICAEGSTQLPRPRSFHNNRPFSIEKMYYRFSIRSLASAASGAAQAMEALAGSNLEGDHSISGANCMLAMKVPSCFHSSTDADILC